MKQKLAKALRITGAIGVLVVGRIIPFCYPLRLLGIVMILRESETMRKAMALAREQNPKVFDVMIAGSRKAGDGLTSKRAWIGKPLSAMGKMCHALARELDETTNPDRVYGFKDAAGKRDKANPPPAPKVEPPKQDNNPPKPRLAFRVAGARAPSLRPPAFRP